ncbi:MAG: hypothetical protein ABIO24_01740 [Saprospiraceae bacterium]
MDNQPQIPSLDVPYNLWITSRLQNQFNHSSKWGKWLMAACLLVNLFGVLYIFFIFQFKSGGFSGLNNSSGKESFLFLQAFVNFALPSFLFYSATMKGLKAWRLLKNTVSVEQSLERGSERLAGMFRFLAIWGGYCLIITLFNSPIEMLLRYLSKLST